MFELKRTRHLHQSSMEVFSTLQATIKGAANEPLQMGIVNKLVELLQAYEDDENTYILVGNYLLDHHQAENYLRLHLMNVNEAGRKTTNFKWVVAVALTKLPDASNSIFDSYAELISVLMREAITLDELFAAIRLLKMFLVVLKSTEYYPANAIEMLFERVNKINQVEINLKK